ncbi:MAG: glucose-6-phosphate isomerase [Acidimicrobiales bacterium]|nr:glucose-6-phosphate isomerase [Acidimicrobiales bacterium]
METLGPIADPVAAALDDLADRRAVERLWNRDHTLFQDDPTEVADRLGWLDVAADMAAHEDRLRTFAEALVADDVEHVVVMGMGGSSLFPEVLARSFAPVAGHPELRVLDTTDPAAVARLTHECPPDDSVFVASSKSGGTIETLSHLAVILDHTGDPGRVVVVTDPGSSLAERAATERFRALFENPADIGGRYSALSFFGLVPAAAAGLDVGALLASATGATPALREPDPVVNAGLALGAVMAGGVRAGRDKLTLVVDGEIDTFALWIEQLVAESTGKAGTGVVPIAGERLGPPDVYGDDRVFVGIGEHHGLDPLAAAGHPVFSLPSSGTTTLGEQVLIWEVATALCGAALGINPFDQPNVAEAKAATNDVLARGPGEVERVTVASLLDGVGPGDYVAIQAYVDPEDGVVDAIEDARTEIRDRLRVATTVGLGPRFLHSTGQLHKGGPATGVFLQVVGDDPADVAIPGRDFGFSALKHAQAEGDLRTLRAHGLRAGRVALDDLLAVAR